ncbi:FAD-dependent oxidoreductase [Microbacterium sp. zg.Y909]|uniref:FAD-dependent oxidoreductase n=1 Tax=Microbacterium sp. zg.Y909 TaxID=2969413 RepID=UPI00214B3328|nr:FAD-dependent oxidoreductase [Microbacterium sp. zg.Y909]MCR2824967.1 FAD-dependent oxidoreductase [Microbacterium sp. zg.Y909]
MTATAITTDLAVIGGGVGGVAAALAAARRGRRVILTERYPWLGGQLTSQAVPPDEHRWVEEFGVTQSYREFRDHVRDHYRRMYPLNRRAREDRWLNPGDGTVSQLCHEPRVAAAVLDEMLSPHIASGRITVLRPFVPISAEMDGERVRSVTVKDLESGAEILISAPFVLDATETGDLLPLTGTAYVVGAEARAEHDEPSAPETADTTNVQAITWCFAIDHVAGDHTIERPEDYDFWRSYQPEFWGAPLLSWISPHPITLEPVERAFDPDAGRPVGAYRSDDKVDLWEYRRVLSRAQFEPGALESDVVIVNWPANDYFVGSIIDVPQEEYERHLAAARSLSLSLLYWLQTEAPRPDGGTGWPQLRLRGDVTGTRDGLAQAPYIRESRRIRAMRTVTERDVSIEVRGHSGPARFEDSVGVGMYRIDLHPSTSGDNYLDVACAPFEIPLGALVPEQTVNLLPAAKNIGTTHITSGAYRLHPVEWNIGEAAALLADFCLARDETPSRVARSERLVADFQRHLVDAGVEVHWPEVAGY